MKKAGFRLLIQPDTYPEKCVSGFIKNHMEITP
jgi:hypothetical protein